MKRWGGFVLQVLVLFVLFPSMMAACDMGGTGSAPRYRSEEEYLFHSLCSSVWGGYADPYQGILDPDEETCTPSLTLKIMVFSNRDGSPLVDSGAHLYALWTGLSEPRRFDFDSVTDNTIFVSFGLTGNGYQLLPCGDRCEGGARTYYGSTACLEGGRAIDIEVQAWANGYLSQTQILTLDNRSSREVMTFFLEPDPG